MEPVGGGKPHVGVWSAKKAAKGARQAKDTLGIKKTAVCPSRVASFQIPTGQLDGNRRGLLFPLSRASLHSPGSVGAAFFMSFVKG